MEQGLTVGVLSPFVGGDYYGALIAGITQAVAAAGGRVVAVQSLDPGSYSADASGLPDFRLPVSWRRAAGFVIITGAVRSGYARALRRAGKPAVLVSSEDPDRGCPAALADNWSGVRAAVAHLVQHGHRRIAFAGHLGVSDVRERYAAYRAALAAHRLDRDPPLLYRIEDNHETGGDLAAAMMLAAGLPSTAVVAGTDRNALGIIATLAAAGHPVPQNQAVIGFDDIPAARFQVPALSSVRQPLEGLGRLAVDLLFAQLRGEPVPAGPRRVPTTFVPRESCGCSRSALPAEPGRSPPGRPPTRDRLVADLTALIPPAQLRWTGPGGPPQVGDAADAVLDLLHAATDGGGLLPEAELRAVLEQLYRLGAQPELLAEIARLVREFVDDMPPPADPGAAQRLERCIQQLILVLSHTQARIQFEDVTGLQAMMNTAYELNMELLRGHTHDPRRLAWLARSPARGGTLGLWEAASRSGAAVESEDRLLRLVGSFCRGQRPEHPRPDPQPDPERADHCLAVSQFPPEQLFDLADEATGHIVFVVPVRSDIRDWGMLAAVAPIQATTPPGRELMNQSGAMLAVALDRDAMLRSLREQEERLRRAALYDQLTGLPNRGLFLDRMRQAMAAANRRPDQGFAVLFLDLDGFKGVNDRLGHAAGDDLLVQVAKRISAGLRETDTAARFGGDEFLLLLGGGISQPEIDRVVGRLHAALTEPFDLGGHRVAISASIGAATSADHDTVESVLRAADAAMYRVKSGRADPGRADPDRAAAGRFVQGIATPGRTG